MVGGALCPSFQSGDPLMTTFSANKARHRVHADWDTANAADDRGFLLAAYKRMRMIREFEQRCLTLSGGASPMVLGSAHFCAGQEAVPVGALAALAPEDRIVATYRGHGWVLECGVPPLSLFAEICQKEDGINGGRAGSAYVMAPDYGLIGENSIVGAGAPIACGAAIASQLAKASGVTVVTFGDGATSQGALHEGMVFAATRNLPVVFVCENNGWSELTPITDIVKIKRLAERARGYGMPGVTIDAGDPKAVRDTFREAVARARRGEGPSFIECKTFRLWGHYNGDTEHYRSKEDRAAAIAADPVSTLRARLIAAGHADEFALAAIDKDIVAAMDEVVEQTRAMPTPKLDTARSHVLGAIDLRPIAAANSLPAEEMTFAAAVNRALHDELAARADMIVYGEDVGKSGGVFGISRDLQKKFGAERVFDTPIAESAIMGSAVGAAFEGLRPVVEIMWSDFLLVALDQLVNQAANVRYVTRGERHLPMVVRTQQGATPGSCAQHSQSLEALLAHIPGLIVGMPSNPHDAYNMLRAAVANPDPCVIIESRAMYRDRGVVDLAADIDPIGTAKVRRQGRHVVLLTWGRITRTVLEAADQLAAKHGIEAAVVDLRWLSPLDDGTIMAAIDQAGGNGVVIHEANLTGGFGAEVAARISETHFRSLSRPIARIATPDIRMPASPVLQAALIPSVSVIVERVRHHMQADAVRVA